MWTTVHHDGPNRLELWLKVINGEPYDFACDLYAFGVVCNEMATRQPPWGSVADNQVLARDSNSGQQLLLSPANWYPKSAVWTTRRAGPSTS